MEAKKHSWHGPKQIGMMIYTAILFLIGTSIIGGNNNTVFPMFSEIRGWDVNVINVVSGLACIAKAIGVLVLARVVRKTGAKNLTTVTLIVTDRIWNDKELTVIPDCHFDYRILGRRL